MSFKPDFHCDKPGCDARAIGVDASSPRGAPPGWYRLFIAPDNGFLDFCSIEHMLEYLRGKIEDGAVDAVITVHPVRFDELRGAVGT